MALDSDSNSLSGSCKQVRERDRERMCVSSKFDLIILLKYKFVVV